MSKKSARSSQKRFLLILIGIVLLGVIGGILLNVFTQKNKCANPLSCIADLSGTYEPKTNGVFMNQKVAVPLEEPLLAQAKTENILGASDNKHIYINLATQTLEAKEGDNVIMSFPISSGKWGRTPTGDFRIWIKLKYTRMQGGSQALGTYYNLPNVPYTMYFYNDKVPKWRGYGLHGAYWHNNFGHPMSHGCINISPDNAKLLYDWATPDSGNRHTTYASVDNPGTLITIYGTAPYE